MQINSIPGLPSPCSEKDVEEGTTEGQEKARKEMCRKFDTLLAVDAEAGVASVLIWWGMLLCVHHWGSSAASGACPISAVLSEL